MKCQICKKNESRITARKADDTPIDICKECLDKSRETKKPLSVACVWKEKK